MQTVDQNVFHERCTAQSRQRARTEILLTQQRDNNSDENQMSAIWMRILGDSPLNRAFRRAGAGVVRSGLGVEGDLSLSL